MVLCWVAVSAVHCMRPKPGLGPTYLHLLSSILPASSLQHTLQAATFGCELDAFFQVCSPRPHPGVSPVPHLT
jgi:hypothetical protein